MLNYQSLRIRIIVRNQAIGCSSRCHPSLKGVEIVPYYLCDLPFHRVWRCEVLRSRESACLWGRLGGSPPTDGRLPPAYGRVPPGLWAVAPQLMGGCPRAYGRLPSALWAVAPQSKFGVVGPCARTLQVRSERDSCRVADNPFDPIRSNPRIGSDRITIPV